MAQWEIDTSQPMEIREDEEMDRVMALLQRDHLVKGTGVVDYVQMLFGTKFNPSTTLRQVSMTF